MDHNSKIVITGSTGMVGSHLVSYLVANGYRNLFLPVRSTQSVYKLERQLRRDGIDPGYAGLEFTETELTDRTKMCALLEGCHVLFHCAANVALQDGEQDKLVKENVAIARSMVKCALETKVGKMIHVSSIATLKPSRDPRFCTDAYDILDDDENLKPYNRGKLLAEREVLNGVHHGLDVTIIKPVTILGEGDWKSGSSVIVPLLAKGIPVYTGGRTSFVDVRDVARAMVLLACKNIPGGSSFILSGSDITFRELLNISAACSGKRAPYIKVGGRSVYTAYYLNRFLASFTSLKLLLSRQVAGLLTEDRCYCGQEIKTIINFDYTPAGITLCRVINTYNNERTT